MIALALFVRENGEQRTPPFALDLGIACGVRLHQRPPLGGICSFRVKEQRAARTQARLEIRTNTRNWTRRLFVWRRGNRRWRCVFDDRLPMVKAGGQRTATDNDRNDNDTYAHD